MDTSVKDAIAELREEGLNQPQIAKLSGVSQGAISKASRGRNVLMTTASKIFQLRDSLKEKAQEEQTQI
ncbi:helix-turn-helix domain-containing protein [Agarilytica rhodophyticola]|uniref:helix-turn-helix domain-containing protein n=1 Tax=Agarilytica rhodophyticola TaxID=1737490 RepID=UPI000B3478C7|nr:hypothetical protein [Agarilytica rhodophyticola]